MTDVLVTGGTGTLGRALVPLLVDAGHGVRVLTRRPDARLPDGAAAAVGDLRTGAGLREAVEGVEVVVHAATDGAGPSSGTDVEGTRRLLAALDRDRLRQVVYVSVVGVDRTPLPYHRMKHETERIVTGSGLPWSILRATQFHEFVVAQFERLRRWPDVVPVPLGWRVQPVATEEVARHLAAMVPLLPSYAVEDYAGPAVHTAVDLARRWRAARGGARVLPFPLPGRASREIRGGSLVAPAAARGRMGFDAWLASG